MKKQIILILALLLLVGISAGAYFTVHSISEKKEQEAIEQAEALNLLSFNSNNINKISIHTQNNEDYTAILNDSGKWKFETETDFDINTYYLNYVASAFSNFKATEKLEPVTDETKKQYGLDNPNIITLYDENNSYTIYAGKETPTKEYYYVMVNDSDDVFLVSSDYKDFLSPSKNSLKSIEIIKDVTSVINHVRLERDGSVIYDITLNDDGSSWSMSEPLETDNVDIATVGNLTASIKQLLIDKFGDVIDKSEYAEYGFDKPAYLLSCKQENGSSVTIAVSEYDPLTTEMVECLNVDTGQIFYCAANYISMLQNNTEVYLQDNVCYFNITNIKEVNVSTPDYKVNMKIDQQNEQYEVDGIDVDELGDEAISSIEDFYNSLKNISSNNLDLNEGITKIAPEIIITYTLKDDSKTSLELIPKDNNSYWTVVNGKYTGFLVDKKTFTKSDGINDMYKALQDTLKS